MSYRELEIFKIAHEFAIDIHHTSINHLPKFEFYEEGSQIRRSSKSVKSNIKDRESSIEIKPPIPFDLYEF